MKPDLMLVVSLACLAFGLFILFMIVVITSPRPLSHTSRRPRGRRGLQNLGPAGSPGLQTRPVSRESTPLRLGLRWFRRRLFGGRVLPGRGGESTENRKHHGSRKKFRIIAGGS